MTTSTAVPSSRKRQHKQDTTDKRQTLTFSQPSQMSQTSQAPPYHSGSPSRSPSHRAAAPQVVTNTKLVNDTNMATHREMGSHENETNVEEQTHTQRQTQTTQATGTVEFKMDGEIDNDNDNVDVDVVVDTDAEAEIEHNINQVRMLGAARTAAAASSQRFDSLPSVSESPFLNITVARSNGGKEGSYSSAPDRFGALALAVSQSSWSRFGSVTAATATTSLNLSETGDGGVSGGDQYEVDLYQ